MAGYRWRGLLCGIGLSLAVAGAAAACAAQRPTITPVQLKGETMVTLGVDLQEGFEEDTVALRIDGQLVARQEGVTTRALLGLAHAFALQLEPGQVTLEVLVETRDLAVTIPLDLSADTYLGVSIVNGRLEYLIAAQPFGYG